MENNKKMQHTSLENLELNHSSLLDLIKRQEKQKTLTEQRRIFQLQLKGLEYFENTYDNELIPNKEFYYDDNLKDKLTRLGMALEKKDFLIETNANVLDKTESQLNIENIVEGLNKDFGLNQEKKLDLPKPKPKTKEELELEEKEKLELDKEPEFKIQLNDAAIAQELTQRAKMDGDLKEVKLNTTTATENGQVASSLVIDMDVKKIENVIQQMDERLNPIKSEEPVKKEDVKEKNDNVPENKQAKGTTESPNKVAKKNNLPKPTPQLSAKKKEDKKVEDPKPQISSVMLNAKVAELTQQFRNKMEKDPTVVDQEKFQTVIRPNTPVFQDKNRISNNIVAMRSRSMDINAPAPEIVENQYGTQEVKTKRKMR